MLIFLENDILKFYIWIKKIKTTAATHFLTQFVAKAKPSKITAVFKLWIWNLLHLVFLVHEK